MLASNVRSFRMCKSIQIVPMKNAIPNRYIRKMTIISFPRRQGSIKLARTLTFYRAIKTQFPKIAEDFESLPGSPVHYVYHSPVSWHGHHAYFW